MSEKKQSMFKWSVPVLAGFLCFILCYLILFRLLGLTSLKTAALQRRNDGLHSEMSVLSRRMSRVEEQLDVFELRDNDIYRPVLGVKPVPQETRRRAFPDPESRYAYLDGVPGSDMMRHAALRLDELTRRAETQSGSFDDIYGMSLHAGEMASSVPYFNPVDLASGRIRLSSRFGYRFHPILNVLAMHTGIDLAGPEGEPIYATGDGVVESNDIDIDGYGINIIIDHGFGYKTRYAHLRVTQVFVGQKVQRGDQIATMGSTGRSTGPHLHYEVMYAGNRVNPLLYINEDITVEEYAAMVHPKGGGY